MTDLKLLAIVITFVALQVVAVNDRVFLRDVDVLTLHRGRMTTGRLAPVSQLNCVGGTAKGRFEPKVVQCLNRGGSNGWDVQWQCKADMDNYYRFGEVSVTCEGYDYPEDAYILQGSCGLEYRLDFTAEGSQKQSQSLKFSDIVLLAIILILISFLYILFFADGNNGPGGHGGGYGGGPDDGHPPPPGFRRPHQSQAGVGDGSEPGFFTGFFTGYLFGRGNGGDQGSRDTGSFGGGSGGGSSGPFTSAAPTSSGTRTASGFGGTKRR